MFIAGTKIVMEPEISNNQYKKNKYHRLMHLHRIHITSVLCILSQFLSFIYSDETLK